MESDRTSEERDRAYGRFKAILSVHSATLEAFEVMAAIPEVSDLIRARIQVRLGVDPKYSAELLDQAAGRVLHGLNEERDRGFETIRGSTLVAVCGAFEHLVKAAFVDQAALNPAEAAALLSKAKIRLAAAEVLGMSSSEQWFAIADRLFEQLAEPHPRMHDRLKHYLLDYTYHSHQLDKGYLDGELGKVDADALNEAFLVRNSVVHRGGRVSSQLARVTKQPAGEAVILDKNYLRRLLAPIRALAPILGERTLQAI